MADVSTPKHIDTAGARVPFGKHRGELVTRVPFQYLRWAVNNLVHHQITLRDGNTVPFHMAASAEIERRGDRASGIEISGHAIDRASLRALQYWVETARPDEGLYSWLERRAIEVYENAQQHKEGYVIKEHNKDRMRVAHDGIDWMFQVDLLLPVLLTLTKQ